MERGIRKEGREAGEKDDEETGEVLDGIDGVLERLPRRHVPLPLSPAVDALDNANPAWQSAEQRTCPHSKVALG